MISKKMMANIYVLGAVAMYSDLVVDKATLFCFTKQMAPSGCAFPIKFAPGII